MRIAICISGQLRNWMIGRDNQKWFWTTFNYPGNQVDYFIHTWNYSWDRPGVSQPYEEREVTQEEYDSLVDFFQPVKSIFDNKRQSYFYNNDHWSSLFYSMSQTLLMKREYELENNFQYDIVVKSRPDVIFHPKMWAHTPSILPDGCLFTTHGGKMGMEFDMINFNDCVFFGNSYTMDLLINLYFYRQFFINTKVCNWHNIHPLGPGTLMHEFFRDYGITPYFEVGWNETLLKQGCPENLNLFEPEDFEIMNNYFREWYTK